MIVEADAPRRCTGGGDAAEAACEIGGAVKRGPAEGPGEERGPQGARRSERCAHGVILCGERMRFPRARVPRGARAC